MKVLKIILLSMSALYVSAGCMKEDSLLTDENMAVNLSAGISYTPVAVKSGGPYNTADQVSLEIEMQRWDYDDGGSSTQASRTLDAVLGEPDSGNSYLRPVTFDTKQYFTDMTSEVGFVGWYPRADGTSLRYNSTARTLEYTVSSGDTDLMISNFVRGSYSSGVPVLAFSHVLCQYSVSVYAVDDNAKEQWSAEYGNITKITLSNIPEKVTAELPEAQEETFTAVYEGETLSYTVTDDEMELPVGSENKKTAGNAVMAAPAKEGVVIITVDFESGKQKQISMYRSYTAGNRYTFTLKFTHNGLIEPVSTIEDWVVKEDADLDIEDGKTYYNLSQNGTANCYIVSSANVSYCFDCTVKGNGVNTVSDHFGNTYRLPDTDVNLSPDRVAIIRTSAIMEKNGDSYSLIEDETERKEAEMLELDSSSPREGKILFTVPGNSSPDDYSLKYKGNVLIGAYREETLLWSWHIWITDRPDAHGYGNGFTSLDRNLGAVTDDPSKVSHTALTTGFYYQWGRKDPLSCYDIEQERNPDDYTEYQRNYPVSISMAHMNPMVFYYSVTGNDWTTDVNDHLWGYTNQRDDVQKTLYDPCPPGYRVPETNVWTQSSQYELASHAKYGYIFEINDKTTTIFYPKTDYIGYDGTNVDVMTAETNPMAPYIYLNSARPHICSDFTGEDGTVSGHESLAHHFVYSSSMPESNYIPYQEEEAGARANAMPVRCVSVNSASATTDLSSIQTANSYIVAHDGYYKFLATRRGNGVTSFNTYDGDTQSTTFVDISAGMTSDITVNRGCYVDLLWWQGELKDGGAWETFVDSGPDSDEIEANVPIAMDDGGLLDEDGYAYFYMKDVPSYGNVGLALYNEQGQILWTWHIWIFSNEQNALLGDYMVMSRNLGATYSPYNASGTFSLDEARLRESYGFYYQWGRKDPVFGREKWCRKTDGKWEVVDWSSGIGQDYIRQATTISASAGSPLGFYAGNGNFWQNTYIPGNANEMRNAWGYVGVAMGTRGDNFVKTMYDPCPPGYRVMNQSSFPTANICSGEEEYSMTLTLSKGSDNGLRLDKTGFATSTYNNGSVIAERIWFPNAGMINNNGVFVDMDGSRGYVNTATPNNGGNQMRFFTWNRTGNSSYSVNQNGGGGHVPARPVRCQKE